MTQNSKRQNKGISQTRQISLILTILILFISPPLLAQLKITADSVNMNYKERITTYIGHVDAKNEDSELKGDKIITHHDQHNKIILMIDTGCPATFKTITSKSKPALNAQAKIIKFFPQQHLAILIGNAYARQGTNSIHASIIHYDTQKRILHSSSNQKSRVHIRIQRSEDRGQKNFSVHVKTLVKTK